MAEPRAGRERLLLFAKAPRPGHVKTRLAKTYGDDVAARLYTAFVRDLVRRVRADRCVIYHDPVEPGPVLEALGLPLLPQRGLDLGARLEAAFTDEHGAGSERVVVIGCDTPDLPLDRVDHAFAALGFADLVLGPALDGGYYLIGARGVPPVFADIPWGSGEVLATTVLRARAAGLEVASLEPWYDVDDEHALHFLHAHLRLLAACGERDRCPETARELRTLGWDS